MIEIKGLYNTAICYTSTLESTAREQIEALCNEETFKDSKIRIMPDVHAGMGCTIGTTMTITDKVVPGMVGVDIGCGMETVKITKREIDLEKLDKTIQRLIPSGRSIRKEPHPLNAQIDLEKLRCKDFVNLDRAKRSIGTLGGGNHFIEVDKDEDGNLYLVVHSGSRHIGNEVAKYYQQEGFQALCGNARFQIDETIKQMKATGNTKQIHQAIKALRAQSKLATPIPKDLAYVEGRLFEDYIHDMKIIQKYAVLNRKAMMDILMDSMALTCVEEFTTIHNYIDTDDRILRKGSVCAKEGVKLLIPINMRDGSIVAVGKGNEEWNFSAPHGAGRLMSRKTALDTLSMEEYKASMDGIYTSCINKKTLDESPMAYKNMDEIIKQISPTAKIMNIIKPIYNYKASE